MNIHVDIDCSVCIHCIISQVFDWVDFTNNFKRPQGSWSITWCPLGIRRWHNSNSCTPWSTRWTKRCFNNCLAKRVLFWKRLANDVGFQFWEKQGDLCAIMDEFVCWLRCSVAFVWWIGSICRVSSTIFGLHAIPRYLHRYVSAMPPQDNRKTWDILFDGSFQAKITHGW